MPDYKLDMNFTFLVKTDDMEKVIREFEFPTFHYPEEKHIEFVSSQYSWEEDNA